MEEAAVAAQPFMSLDNEAITASDLMQPENAQTAPRGQRRQQQNAEASTEDTVDPSLRFLSITKIRDLVAEGDRPMRHIGHLLSLLGSTAKPRRAEPSSNLRTGASLIKHYICFYLKLPGLAQAVSDEILSSSLRQFLAATEPGDMLRSGRADAESLRSEGIDGMRCGSPTPPTHAT